MKKTVSLFLLIAILLLCVGCDTTSQQTDPLQEASSQVLKVGFGRADISPEISVPLWGYGNHETRYSTEVADPIYATCVAFTDEFENTVLLFHLDLASAFAEQQILARSEISKATGIPVSNIYLAGTHQHAGPALPVVCDAMNIYLPFYYGKLVEAAKQALEDRKPGEMYTNTAHPVGLNFVRHYVMSDGSVIGDNFGSAAGKQYVKHVWEADNTMQLVRFVREGGKDIVLINWQAHPHRNSSSNSTHITSDIVGAFRDYFEAESGCLFAYFNGGGGNLNSISRIERENAAPNYLEHGRQLAQYAIRACDNMKKVQTGNVQTVNQKLDVISQKSGPYTIDMYAFSIGDVAFVCAPYEMFDVNALYIKNNSQFGMTFVVGYTQSGNGYIAAEESYAYGGYEVEYRLFEKGTAETLASKYVEMLKSLYPTK